MNAAATLDAETLVKQFTPVDGPAIDADRQLIWSRFGQDGKLLLAADYQGKIRRWRMEGETPEELAPITGHHGWTQAFALHPTEPILYTADSWGELRATRYAEEATGAKLDPLWQHTAAHDGWIRALSLSADGSRLASVGNDHHVRIFDTAKGKLLHEIRVSDHHIFAVALSPDGKTVVTCDLFCKLEHHDVATGDKLGELDASTMHYYDRDQDVCGLRVMRFQDAETLLCAGAEPTSAGRGHGIAAVYYFNVKTGNRTQRLEQGVNTAGFIVDAVDHPAGFVMTVAVGQPGKGALVFQRPEDEKPFFEHPRMSNTHSIALHPDGKSFLVIATKGSGQGNGAVKDKEGNYLGNISQLRRFTFPTEEAVAAK